MFSARPAIFLLPFECKNMTIYRYGDMYMRHFPYSDAFAREPGVVDNAETLARCTMAQCCSDTA
jgi:hypothetical protein